ncbi:MAG TPA: DUF2721 domain-containing protein [Thermoanaerobaculaceae bacterium]|nr:DUF2721 domain-containing protein [Thermoanaerobaculaceae bacterium]HPS76909.1 DUF2721 domain-containing protein [Thermoanaerobaculaceae bacterium]
MNTQFPYAVLAIQAILAPAVMVSACGLLLLGLLNRYGVVMARVRALNEERRRLLRNGVAAAGTEAESERLGSVIRQVDDLVDRIRLLRNAVVSQIIGVGCFVLTSLLIGLRVAGPEILQRINPLPGFLLGMAVVFVGLTFEGLDVVRAYRTIRMEVDEEPHGEREG